MTSQIIKNISEVAFRRNQANAAYSGRTFFNGARVSLLWTNAPESATVTLQACFVYCLFIVKTISDLCTVNGCDI